MPPDGAPTRTATLKSYRKHLATGTVALLFIAVPVVFAATNAAPAALTGHAAQPFNWRAFLGPFHHLVLHYPIGFVTLSFLLEILYWRRPSQELRGITRFVTVLGAASAIVAAALGLMRAAEGGYDENTLGLHKWFGISVGALAIVAGGVVIGVCRHPASKAWLWSYRGLLATTLLALGIAGHQGGTLSHGSNYLTKDAPAFIRDIFEEGHADPEASSNGLTPGELLYAEKVQPVLQKQCYQCHGAEKKKGGLRLDVSDGWAKGGDSGEPTIKAGDPLASELVRLILLPKEHEDLMPPVGKGHLMPEEILDIIHWIQVGAPVHKPN